MKAALYRLLVYIIQTTTRDGQACSYQMNTHYGQQKSVAIANTENLKQMPPAWNEKSGSPRMENWWSQGSPPRRAAPLALPLSVGIFLSESNHHKGFQVRMPLLQEVGVRNKVCYFGQSHPRHSEGMLPSLSSLPRILSSPANSSH